MKEVCLKQINAGVGLLKGTNVPKTWLIMDLFAEEILAEGPLSGHR